MTPEEMDAVIKAAAVRVKAEIENAPRITAAQAVAAGLIEPPENSVDRRLGQTEEGRMQRILVISIGISAALAFGLEYLDVDATPAYSLMAAASAALIGNAGLGAARQFAKAKVEAAREGGEA